MTERAARGLRLPLLPAEPDELPPIDDALRAPFSVPSIALVSVRRSALETSLRALRAGLESARMRFTELEVILRDGAATIVDTPTGRRLAAPLLALPACLAEVDAGLSDEALVTVGSAVVAIRAPRLSILLTAGLPSTEWDADVRSVRRRFDLVVPELDAALARELAARL
ncbi:MAG: hypothetical protein ACK6CU_13955 [Deltaproteobacteria bacterium]